MPRISDKEMSKRVEALQDILEDNPEGLTVAEMVIALKDKGIILPKSEYQAVHIVLKGAQREGVIVKEGNKWVPIVEEN